MTKVCIPLVVFILLVSLSTNRSDALGLPIDLSNANPFVMDLSRFVTNLLNPIPITKFLFRFFPTYPFSIYPFSIKGLAPMVCQNEQ